MVYLAISVRKRFDCALEVYAPCPDAMAQVSHLNAKTWRKTNKGFPCSKSISISLRYTEAKYRIEINQMKLKINNHYQMWIASFCYWHFQILGMQPCASNQADHYFFDAIHMQCGKLKWWYVEQQSFGLFMERPNGNHAFRSSKVLYLSELITPSQPQAEAKSKANVLANWEQLALLWIKSVCRTHFQSI